MIHSVRNRHVFINLIQNVSKNKTKYVVFYFLLVYLFITFLKFYLTHRKVFLKKILIILHNSNSKIIIISIRGIISRNPYLFGITAYLLIIFLPLNKIIMKTKCQTSVRT